MINLYMTEVAEVFGALAAAGHKVTKRQDKAIRFLLLMVSDWDAAKTSGVLKAGMYGEELNLGFIAELYAKEDGLSVPSADRIMREARALLRTAQPGNFLWLTQEHNRVHAA